MHGSQLLTAWRARAKKSQTACAEEVGVHQPTWSDWEAGRKNPRIAHAVAIETLTKDEAGVPAVPVASWGAPKTEPAAATASEEEAAPESTPEPAQLPTGS